mgnify:CR=1 FL=1
MIPDFQTLMLPLLKVISNGELKSLILIILTTNIFN